MTEFAEDIDLVDGVEPIEVITDFGDGEDVAPEPVAPQLGADQSQAAPQFQATQFADMLRVQAEQMQQQFQATLAQQQAQFQHTMQQTLAQFAPQRPPEPQFDRYAGIDADDPDREFKAVAAENAHLKGELQSFRGEFQTYRQTQEQQSLAQQQQSQMQALAAHRDRQVFNTVEALTKGAPISPRARQLIAEKLDREWNALSEQVAGTHYDDRLLARATDAVRPLLSEFRAAPQQPVAAPQSRSGIPGARQVSFKPAPYDGKKSYAETVAERDQAWRQVTTAASGRR